MGKPYTYDPKNYTVTISEEIDDWWGVGLARLQQDLSDVPKGQPVVLYLNSPGGSVFEGQAIAGWIRNSNLNIEVRIVGVCASIATVIALSSSSVKIARGSTFMIHNAWISNTSGEAKHLRKQADLLDQMGNQVAELYQAAIQRNGKTATIEQIKEWMSETKYMTAKEAVELGFVQSMLEDEEYQPTKEEIENLKNQLDAPIPTRIAAQWKSSDTMAADTSRLQKAIEGFKALFPSKNSSDTKEKPEDDGDQTPNEVDLLTQLSALASRVSELEAEKKQQETLAEQAVEAINDASAKIEELSAQNKAYEQQLLQHASKPALGNPPPAPPKPAKSGQDAFYDYMDQLDAQAK